MNDKNQIIIYSSEDGQTKVEVKLEDETVWLTQEQMAELFDKGRSTITEHINNVIKERELEENSVCRFFRRTGNDGKVVEIGLEEQKLNKALEYANKSGAVKIVIFAQYEESMKIYKVKDMVSGEEKEIKLN